MKDELISGWKTDEQSKRCDKKEIYAVKQDAKRILKVPRLTSGRRAELDAVDGAADLAN